MAVDQAGGTASSEDRSFGDVTLDRAVQMRRVTV
jgi:hypothetical protein